MVCILRPDISNRHANRSSLSYVVDWENWTKPRREYQWHDRKYIFWLPAWSDQLDSDGGQTLLNR